MMALMDMNLSDPESVEDWARTMRLLQPTIPTLHGTHTLADLLHGVLVGQFQWWLSATAAALTEIIEYPQLKAAHVFMIGGDFESIKDWLRRGGRFDEWAFEEIGVDRQTYVGRNGLKRVIEDIERIGEVCYRGKPNG